MYGSMATGLALEGSDVDVAIAGLPIYNREQLLACMQMLYYALERQDFVLECKLIPAATVPVIKLVP